MEIRFSQHVSLPDFAERRRLREATGLSGHAFATQIGVSPASIYRWETEGDPAGIFLNIYADALEQVAKQLGDG